jgi:hypothetical protein
MWYEISRNGNSITIENTHDGPITLKTFYGANCGDTTQLEVDTILPEESHETQLGADGIYEFVLDAEVDGQLEVIEFTVEYYDNFLQSLITTLENLFCDCGCDNCDDCIEYDILLDGFYKVMTYYTLTRRYYAGYIDAVMSCSKCETIEEIHCIVNNEKYLGGHNNISFLKKLLGYYYLSFYFAEVEEDNEDEIKTKFKYDTIMACLKGIDINCIKQKINDMGLFTINNAAYINQPPSEVGDYSTSLPNRTDLTITLAMFTSSTTPPYSDPEGDPADAVRIDSLPSNGTLLLSGTPVTPGQVIDVADINAGNLVFDAPEQDALSSINFNFSVRDTGSLTFVS